MSSKPQGRDFVVPIQPTTTRDGCTVTQQIVVPFAAMRQRYRHDVLPVVHLQAHRAGMRELWANIPVDVLLTAYHVADGDGELERQLQMQEVPEARKPEERPT